MGPKSTNVFCGGVRTTSFTNTLPRKKKSTKSKTVKEDEPRSEVCGPKKSLEPTPRWKPSNIVHFGSPCSAGSANCLANNPFQTGVAHEERTGHIEGYDEKKDELVTFEFPIIEADKASQMKNITPSALPNFRGFLVKILMPFYLSLMCCAGAMTILPMLRR